MDKRVCLQIPKVKFWRVCGFRVRVWESYRTSRSFGYGYGSVTELPEVRGIVARAYITYRSSGYGYECPTQLTEVPGTGNTRVNAHPLGGEFKLKWNIQSNLHDMFSLGQCPRGNLS